ncbi:MAG: cysteine--tRNA ligase [Actinomycetes bacterium]
MSLQLYDTASRKLAPVTSTNGTTTMYCCGPTVYRDAHVGNLRTFLLSDLVRRALTTAGVDVKLIQNITDVGHMSEDIETEDKMLAQAKAESIDPFTVARKYEAAFHTDLARLNIQKADAYPRASESIELMLAMIEELIAKKFAYLGEDGTVYFSAQSFPSYGAISGNRLDALKPGHRYEYSEDGAKRFHADWALWKSAGTRSEMIWDSPWGPGFPGWHIECSAMSLHFLNSHINLHVGGIDLRFPHHENERAQSNAITGNESVDLWLHGEHLLFEGRKMSKSARNVVLLSDVIDRGFDPLAVRLCFLENRYRSQMDLTWASIEAADATLKRWRKKIKVWGKQVAQRDSEFLEIINNDLDTPKAIQYLRNLEKNDDNVDRAAIFLFADQVLGLDLDREEVIKALSLEQEETLKLRQIARNEKRWTESDELRIKLEESGLEIMDGPGGQVWTWR